MAEAIAAIVAVVITVAIQAAIAGAIMYGLSLLMPRPHLADRTIRSKVPEFASFSFQSAYVGTPVPKIFGCVKLAGNVIYLGPDEPYVIEHKSVVKTSGGGKGGGGGSSKTTTITYETRYRKTFILALCEGPAKVKRIWSNKDIISTSACTIFNGLDNQNVASVTGLEFAQHRHICLAYFSHYELGNQNSLPQFQFEVCQITEEGDIEGYPLNTWDGICYGNGIFVAVSTSGNKNRVMTSSDGINWTSRVSAANYLWHSIAFGNGIFVAVAASGSGNRVMTSTDGITWVIQISAANNQWQSICFGNGLFVAVASSGTGNRVMTSPDGINWTIRASAANNSWNSVCYGLLSVSPISGLFVAVASSGTGNRVMTSPDGINWTIRASAANNQWQSICFGNGLFVAVALSGLANRVMTSTDGISWTIRTSAANNLWYGIIYENSLFVAVAAGGTANRVMTSIDGISWTIQTNSNEIMDANPADVVRFLLTDNYTGAGLPLSLIDESSFDVAQAFCEENGYKFSFKLNTQRPLVDWLDEVMSHCFGFLVFSEGKYKFKLFRDEESIFSLTQDSLVEDAAKVS